MPERPTEQAPASAVKPAATAGPAPRLAGVAPGLPLLGLVGLAVVVYFLPQIIGGSLTAYNTIVVIAIFSVMAYGVDIVLSYLGEVSLGHTVFWAAGAYAAGIAGTRAGMGSWATLGVSIGVVGALALAIGLITLRTREFVFSLVTYATAVVGVGIASNWQFLGGSNGISGVPLLDLSLFGLHLEPRTNQEFWPYAFGLLAFVVFLVARFRRSRLGVTALMVNQNPDLAVSLGVNQRLVRVLVFLFSAIVTGLAGWLYAYQRAFVSADLFGTYFLILMLAAVVLVGRRVLIGPIVGVAIIIGQQDFASAGGTGDQIIMGGVLAAVLLFWPRGLIGAWYALRGAARRAVGKGGAPPTNQARRHRKESESGHDLRDLAPPARQAR